jgi:hypothetical protein
MQFKFTREFIKRMKKDWWIFFPALLIVIWKTYTYDILLLVSESAIEMNTGATLAPT